METLVEAAGEVDTIPTAHPLVLVTVAILSIVQDELVTLLRCSSDGGTEQWSLPSHPPVATESLDDAARRELQRAVGGGGYVEQLYTWGDPGNQGPGRVLEIGYL